MTKKNNLCSLGFLAINLQFALVTTIMAMFFAFSAYLAHLGVSPATAGFIISADALAALIVLPVIAPLVHAAVARRWFVCGSLAFGAALFMAGQVTSVPLLITARLLQGTGFIAVVSALIAMVVRYIPSDMSGRAFGLLSLVRLIPYAIIPPLFEVLNISASSFGALLTLAGGVVLVPIAVLMFPLSSRSAVAEDSQPPGFSGMLESLRSPAVLLLLLSAMLFFIGYSGIFYYLKNFGAARGIANAGFFFSIATIIMILVRLFGGWLFDRCNKVALCVAGLLAVAVSYALLPLCASSSLLFLLAGVSGLGWGIAMPLQAAVMFDISALQARGMNQNLMIVMMQAGFFLGPLFGGWIISLYGYTALFSSLAAATFASLLMMAAVPAVCQTPITKPSRVIS